MALLELTYHSLVSHVLKQVLGPITELDEERLDIMKSLDMPLMLLTRTDNDASSFSIMNTVAQQHLSEKFFVGVMTSPAAHDESASKLPFLTTFNALDDTRPTYHGPLEASAILEFASHVSSPLIRQFESSSLVSFMDVSTI